MSSSFKLKSDAKARAVEMVKAKSVKKVYNLPGQKQDPPEERDPSRIFYESLSKQIPSSEMAEFWLMEHGLLPPDKAKKALDRKQRKQQELRTGGTPVKSQKLDRPESSRPQPPKRMSCDSDDEFIIKRIKSRV